MKLKIFIVLCAFMVVGASSAFTPPSQLARIIAHPEAAATMMQVVAASGGGGGEEPPAGITYTYASANGDTGSPAITHGLSISSGDIVIAFINVNTQVDADSITDNNGATPFTVDDSEYPENSNACIAIFSRIAGASEPGTYNFSVDAADETWAIGLLVISGANATYWDNDPADVTEEVGYLTDVAMPSITVTAGALGICFVACDRSSETNSFDNSYSEIIDVAINRTLAIAVKEFVGAGASGITTDTISSLSRCVGWQVSVAAD